MGDYKDKNGKTRVGAFLKTIGGVAPEILNLAGTVTGIDALNKLGDAIRKTDTLTPENKESALAMLEMDRAEYENITARWQADMTSDSWLSKNVRPLVMVFLTLSMTIYIVIDSSVAGFMVKNEWIDLLSTLLLVVYAAYFGGRSLEKIQKTRKNK
jgi:hypothetical protein